MVRLRLDASSQSTRIHADGALLIRGKVDGGAHTYPGPRPVGRLAIPLVAWGVLELLFYCSWNLLTGHDDLAFRPVNVATVLLGSNSHRYFLPWLIIATTLVYGLTALIEALKFRGAAVLVAMGPIAAFVPLALFGRGHAHPWFIDWYHHGFFQALGGYILSALPYTGMAILFCLVAQWRVHWVVKLILGFLGLAANHYGGMTSCGGMLLSAAGALVFGLVLPPVQLPLMIRRASSAAYGIYLSHMLVFFIVGAIAKRLGVYSNTLPSLLGMALTTYLGAWVVSMAMERDRILRWLFLGAPRETRPTSTTSVGPVPTVATPTLQTA